MANANNGYTRSFLVISLAYGALLISQVLNSCRALYISKRPFHQHRCIWNLRASGSQDFEGTEVGLDSDVSALFTLPFVSTLI
jgi:hypothetical protein